MKNPARKNSSLLARSIPPSSVGIDPAFPRICGYRPESGCGRISREQRRGEALMETGHAEKGKRRSSPDRGRPAGSVRPAILLPATGTALLRSGTRREERAANFDKIPNNSINIDKFTGFFGKKRKRERIANNCNIMAYLAYLSAGDSNMNIIFSAHRICPHL